MARRGSLCTACSEAGAGGRGRRAPRGLGWAGAEGGVGSSAQSCPHAAPGLACGPMRGRWPGEGPCRPLGQGVHLADIRVDACPEGRTRAGPWPPSPHGLPHPRLLRLLARTPAVSAREAAGTGARSRAFRQARPRPGPTPAVHGDRRSTPSPAAGHGVPRPGPGWQCVWGGGGAAPGCSGRAATGTPEGPRLRAEGAAFARTPTPSSGAPHSGRASRARRRHRYLELVRQARAARAVRLQPQLPLPPLQLGLELQRQLLGQEGAG